MLATELQVRRAASRALPLLGIIVLYGAMGYGWWTVAQRMAPAERPKTIGHPTAIVWGDRVYASPAAFKQWLKARGVRYRSWARRHPAALRIVDPAAVKTRRPVPTRVAGTHRVVTRTTPKPAPAPVVSTKRAPGRVAIAAPTSRRSVTPLWLAAPLCVLAAALVIASLLLGRIGPLRLAGRRPLHVVIEYRAYLLVAAAALIVGLLSALAGQ